MSEAVFKIEDLATILKQMKQRRDRGKSTKGCTLLIGAGCSITGNIPGAPKIIERIKEDYPYPYSQVPSTCHPEELYGECMSKLTTDERQDLFEQLNEKATINQAHLYIAALMEAGYINRIMSVNFDNLLVRACALVHLFPAIYDLTVAPSTADYGAIDQQAIFYLHGQIKG